MEILVERPDDVRAVLADTRFVPVPPGPAGPVGSMAWLRSTVARFSHGPEHARRRAIVEADLAAIAPERLAAAAARSPRPAGEVAVAVLAEALGVADDDAVVAAVATVAAVYLAPGDTAAERAADDAVAALVALFHPVHPVHPADGELVANRIGLLVQAYAATAGLVRAAVEHRSVMGGLRAEPPVRGTRRVATVDTSLAGTEIASGDTLVLDLAAAGLPFGGEPRVCPGRAHAFAIAHEVAHKVAQEAADEVAHKVAQEAADEVAQDVAREVAPGGAQDVAREVTPGGAQDVAREVAPGGAQEVARGMVREAAQEVAHEGVREVVR